VVAVVVAACRTTQPTLHVDTPAGHWHTVERGETVEDIARDAGVPAQDILELNGIDDRSDVQPGRLLFVLAPRTPIAAAAAPATPAAADHSDGSPPFRWPLSTVPVTVGSPFGARWGRPHEGIDLPAPIGTPVFAAADGRVVYAGNGIRGYGNLVVVKHAGDVLTVYAHNSVLLVSEGQPVRAGDTIARVGQSGHATGPHLHFEVRIGQIPRDPMPYLPRRPPSS
jgi:murein DD-endopeptidase MepM/ murein hydrolase activator NlpD